MAINPITGVDESAQAAAFARAGSTTKPSSTVAAVPAPSVAAVPAATAPSGMINTAIYAGIGAPAAKEGPIAAQTAPTTTPTATPPATDVANWYRSSLGRDPDQAGLDYWNQQIKNGTDVNQVYKAFQTAAKDDGGSAYHAPNTYQEANDYKGPTSSNTRSTVDDWAQNVLGRSLTAGEVSKYDQLMASKPGVEGAKLAYNQFLQDYSGQVKNNMDWMAASQINLPPTPTVTVPGIAQYNAINASINPETDTVQGQINGLLRKGNPLLDRAAALSDQKSNERGLVYSSMGVQAGQTAVLDAALQIATPDAGFYNQQRLANQSYQNDAAKTNASAQNTVNNMGYNNQLTQSNMGLQQQYTQANATQANLNAIALNDAQLAGNLKNSLATLQANASTAQGQNAYNQALQTVSDLNAALTAIQGNPNLDAAAVASQRNKAIEVAKSRLSYLSSLSGVDYGDLIKYFNLAETP